MLSITNNNFKTELECLLDAKKQFIYIQSAQEKEVMAELINILLDKEIEDITAWSYLLGQQSIKVFNDGIKTQTIANNTPVSLFNKYTDNISLEENNSAIILKDFHLAATNPGYIRVLRDISNINAKSYMPIILLSPINEVPKEMSEIFTVIKYDMPNKDIIKDLLNDYQTIRNVSITNDINTLTKLFTGFSKQEIIDILDYSFAKYGNDDLKLIRDKKIEVIKNTDMLEYASPRYTLNDIGGNNNIKEWLEETKICMSEEAREYNLDKPKGILSLGIPGCAKSILAEAIASEFDVPFIKFKISQVMSRYVGNTEHNMDKALDLIKSCAPCVLLIDEVEKVLGGYKGSSSSGNDGGALARVMGSLLNFMTDNEDGVYVVMTSNDVKQLPPELTRTGRLDAIWYFSNPNKEEREEILNIHLNKVHQKLSSNTVKEVAKSLNNFTGAEIEQLVKLSLKKAYVRKVKNKLKDCIITKDDLLLSSESIVPIVLSSREAINELEDWVKGRALYANKKVNNKNELSIENLDDFI